MSALFLSPNGALMSFKVEFCMARWGGGANPGKTHVYPPYSAWFWKNAEAAGSMQCVTDDFGNLVRAE